MTRRTAWCIFITLTANTMSIVIITIYIFLTRHS